VHAALGRVEEAGGGVGGSVGEGLHD